MVSIATGWPAGSGGTIGKKKPPIQSVGRIGGCALFMFFFQIEKSSLFIESAAVADHVAICADDADFLCVSKGFYQSGSL
jgi:hypothetical protein